MSQRPQRPYCSRCLQKKIHLYIKDNNALNYLYQLSYINIDKCRNDNALVMLRERGWPPAGNLFIVNLCSYWYINLSPDVYLLLTFTLWIHIVFMCRASWLEYAQKHQSHIACCVCLILYIASGPQFEGMSRGYLWEKILLFCKANFKSWKIGELNILDITICYLLVSAKPNEIKVRNRKPKEPRTILIKD